MHGGHSSHGVWSFVFIVAEVMSMLRGHHSQRKIKMCSTETHSTDFQGYDTEN